MVYLALTYDHRIVDGADAARFLTRRQGAGWRPGSSRSVTGILTGDRHAPDR